MEKNTNKYKKHACACCGYFTITDIKETCPVCFWEEDSYQEQNIDDTGGPNATSLRMAQKNYMKYGVMAPEFKEYVRPPLEEEL